MEDKLVLGLPNDGRAIVAPANAFRFGEKDQPGRVKHAFLPALLIGAVAAELASSDADGEGEPVERHDDDIVGGIPPLERNLARVESVAALLHRLSAEIAAETGEAVRSAETISVRLRHGGDDAYPSAGAYMQRLFRAFNDNDGRILPGEDSFHFPFGPQFPIGGVPGAGGGGGFAAAPPPGGDGGQEQDDGDDPATGPPFGDDASPPKGGPGAGGSEEEDDGGGGNGGGGGDDGEDGDGERVNRLPVSTSRPVLSSTVMNVSALILLGDLLRGVHDPDGDPLSILDIGVSDGRIEAYGPGRWLYTPDRGALGEMVFTYRVSDGYGAITVRASMDVVRPAPREISGTEGDDRLFGTPFEDVIDGRGGDDFIYGRESGDVIFGGAGDDTLLGGAGDDVLYGGAGRDMLFGGAGDDILFGGDDADHLYGEDGDDSLMGGSGGDALAGGTGDDRLFGEDGDDRLLGEAGDDLLEGGAGNDDLAGGGGRDTVVGGTGDDIVRMGLAGEEARHDGPPASDGDDVYSGGEGVDTLDAGMAGSGVAIDLTAGVATGASTGSDRVEGFENVVGSRHDDTLTGDAADNVLHGGAGDDRLAGGGGGDVVCAGDGDDVVVVLARMGAGDDGDDVYDAGDGVDTLDLGALIEAVIADFDECYVEGGEIGRDTIRSFEIVRGGAGDDELRGGRDSDILHGAAGDDRLRGRAGDDILVGGAGADEVEGGAGNDTFLVVAPASGAAVSDGADTFDGADGVDIYDASATRLGVTIDLSAGTAAGSEIGADRLTGVEAAVGGSGDDVLRDGVSVTILTGGAGNDIFAFGFQSISGGHRDEIRDFAAGDRIDFSAIGDRLAFAGLRFEDAPQTGSVTFYHQRFEDSERTVVRAIIDLEHDDDIEILLHGRYQLTDQDFIFAALELAAREGAPT